MLTVECGALRTFDSVLTKAAADSDANRDSNGQPDGKVSGSDPERCAYRRSQRDA
jgi:hypothetical protein